MNVILAHFFADDLIKSEAAENTSKYPLPANQYTTIAPIVKTNKPV